MTIITSWFAHNYNAMLAYLGVGASGKAVEELSGITLFDDVTTAIYVWILIFIAALTAVSKVQDIIKKHKNRNNPNSDGVTDKK